MQLPSFSFGSSSQEELRDILTQWGFFYLRGEEADRLVKLSENAFEESKRLLALPSETLESYSNEKELYGYFDLRKETSGKAIQNQIGWYHRPGGSTPMATPALDVYFKECCEVLLRLLERIYEVLHLDSHDVATKNYFSTLTLRSYFESHESRNQTGINPHSDFGLLTLLIATAPGLEVYHQPSKQWVPVNTAKDMIVINIGDWLRLLSGDRISAAFHRVHNVPIARQFLGFFLDAPLTDRLVAKNLETGLDEEMSYADYLAMRFNDSYNRFFSVNLKDIAV